MRHWVLTPPVRWARVLPEQSGAAQRFRTAVVRRVVSAIERRAREQLGHGRGRAGALAVLHTVGADLRPRAHVHVIATDGVFVPAQRGAATFVQLGEALGDPELRELAHTVGREARAVLPETPGVERGAAGQRVIGAAPASSPAGRVAQARGAEVFCGERVEAHDRGAAQRLAAYVTRPPLHPASIEPTPEGGVQLGLREPAADRAVAVRVSRDEFDARVQAMLRHAPVRPLTLHGALAPGSGVRWRGEGQQLKLIDDPGVARARRGAGEAAQRCSCGGRLRVIAAEPVDGLR